MKMANRFEPSGGFLQVSGARFIMTQPCQVISVFLALKSKILETGKYEKLTLEKIYYLTT